MQAYQDTSNSSIMGLPARVLPDTLKPDVDPSIQISGEQSLMLGILEEAKRTLRHPTGKRYRQDWLDAWCWLFDDSLDLLYSFPSICYVFNRDPALVRQQILRTIPFDVFQRLL